MPTLPSLAQRKAAPADQAPSDACEDEAEGEPSVASANEQDCARGPSSRVHRADGNHRAFVQAVAGKIHAAYLAVLKRRQRNEFAATTESSPADEPLYVGGHEIARKEGPKKPFSWRRKGRQCLDWLWGLPLFYQTTALLVLMCIAIVWVLARNPVFGHRKSDKRARKPYENLVIDPEGFPRRRFTSVSRRATDHEAGSIIINGGSVAASRSKASDDAILTGSVGHTPDSIGENDSASGAPRSASRTVRRAGGRGDAQVRRSKVIPKAEEEIGVGPEAGAARPMRFYRTGKVLASKPKADEAAKFPLGLRFAVHLDIAASTGDGADVVARADEDVTVGGRVLLREGDVLLGRASGGGRDGARMGITFSRLQTNGDVIPFRGYAVANDTPGVPAHRREVTSQEIKEKSLKDGVVDTAKDLVAAVASDGGTVARSVSRNVVNRSLTEVQRQDHEPRPSYVLSVPAGTHFEVVVNG